ncbi:hypothetical protein DPMN_083359 [Dreissena polymorpha]|uniref:Uncharacterized protein n=1 Tax=Dreissena polymorpha TaxID=45954 RepID=A0A9D4BB13_DREPO|nr:hypothetical protein DPMN_083359 [Dreissena polymorpha]
MNMQINERGRKVILVCEEEAFQFTTRDGETIEKTLIEDLKSTQDEIDTRVIMYALYKKEQGNNTIQIRSLDSDIFCISLYYIQLFDGCKILFDTGAGNHRKLFYMNDVATG